MQVSVRDNNVDQALRALKKKLQREGVFRSILRSPPKSAHAKKPRLFAVLVSSLVKRHSAKGCFRAPFQHWATSVAKTTTPAALPRGFVVLGHTFVESLSAVR